jgi:hypothetical protein
MRETSHIWSLLDSVGKLKKVWRIRPYTAYGPPGPESVAFFRDALPDEVGPLEAWWPDFGDCLAGAIDQLLALGQASAVVLTPTVPSCRRLW